MSASDYFAPSVKSVTQGSGSVVVSGYVHMETRAERLLRLSNQVATEVARLMGAGREEAEFVELAESADALADLARFIDPQVGEFGTTYTVMHSEAF